MLVAYPHPGSKVEHSFVMSLRAACEFDRNGPHRIDVRQGPWMMRVGTGGLVDGRNKTIQGWLDGANEEWLMMIDSDMGFAADAIERLVESAHPVERPIMGGLCFGLKMTDPDGYGGYLTAPFPTIYVWVNGPDGSHGFKAVTGYPPDQIVRCSATGAAFLLVHRIAAETVRAKFGDTWFEPVRYPDGRLLSEDLSFCYRLAQCQIPVHVDTSVKTTHAKTVWVGEREWVAHNMVIEAIAKQQSKAEVPSAEELEE